MFKKSPEQQIVIEADKVASMKESLDALSWDRVIEISKQLQNNPTEDERYELARELMAIANANTTLLGKLGIATTSFSGKMMPSGVEMLQGLKTPVTLPTGEPALPLNNEMISQACLPDQPVTKIDVPVPGDATEAHEVKTEAVGEKKPEAPQKAAKQSSSFGSTVRSILFPAKEPEPIIPDASNDVSDFFSTPSSDSEYENFIPRGEITPVGDDGVRKEVVPEYAQNQAVEVNPVVEAAKAATQKPSDEGQNPSATERGSIFDSVLEIMPDDTRELQVKTASAPAAMPLANDVSATEKKPTATMMDVSYYAIPGQASAETPAATSAAEAPADLQPGMKADPKTDTVAKPASPVQSVPKPATQAKTESVAQTAPAPQPQPKPVTQVTPVSASAPASQPKPVTQAAPTAQAQNPSAVQAKPAAQPATAPPAAQAKPAPQPQVQSVGQASTTPKPAAQTKAAAQPESKPATQAKPEPTLHPDIDKSLVAAFGLDASMIAELGIEPAVLNALLREYKQKKTVQDQAVEPAQRSAPKPATNAAAPAPSASTAAAQQGRTIQRTPEAAQQQSKATPVPKPQPQGYVLIPETPRQTSVPKPASSAAPAPAASASTQSTPATTVTATAVPAPAATATAVQTPPATATATATQARVAAATATAVKTAPATVSAAQKNASVAKASAGSAREKGNDSTPAGKKPKKRIKQDLSDFKQIYASRDGSLCLYKDAAGHIVAVDSNKLA